MKFSAIVEQVLAMLQRQGRISYRALKREFDLDDAYIEDLKEEIIKARRLAVDEDGAVLVWVGNSSPESRVQSLESEEPGRTSIVQTSRSFRRQHPRRAAERDAGS